MVPASKSAQKIALDGHAPAPPAAVLPAAPAEAPAAPDEPPPPACAFPPAPAVAAPAPDEPATPGNPPALPPPKLLPPTEVIAPAAPLPPRLLPPAPRPAAAVPPPEADEEHAVRTPVKARHAPKESTTLVSLNKEDTVSLRRSEKEGRYSVRFTRPPWPSQARAHFLRRPIRKACFCNRETGAEQRVKPRVTLGAY